MKTAKNLALIAAMSADQVIGYQNQLPWNIPEDLQYFRAMTLGKPIIMGHKTFASMGYKALPKRQNILLTRDPTGLLRCARNDGGDRADTEIGPYNDADARKWGAIYSGVQVVGSLEEALEVAEPAEEIMVIGGSQIYALALPKATRLYLNIIEGDYPGDTFFPTIDWADWDLVSEEPRKGFRASIFQRKIPPT